MSRPLPQKTRWILFIIGAIIFSIVAPLLVFYSTGYRFSGIQTLEETGGIYFHSWLVNGAITVNDKTHGNGNLFNPGKFIQGLQPGFYEASMSREGYTTWEKTLPVEAGRVTEANPFILPLEPEAIEISKTIVDPGTKKEKTNALYTKVNALFAEKPIASALASTASDSYQEGYVENQNIALYKNGDRIYAHWLGEDSLLPTYFCNQICNAVIPVSGDAEKIIHFDFFPGKSDLFIAALPDGIYVIEIDTRGNQNRALLYSGTGLNFRIENSHIYIKKDTHLLEVSVS